MNENEVLFDIPRCGYTAEFKKYKNANWKFSIINNNNNEKNLVNKSINEEIMKKVINELSGDENNVNRSFHKSVKTLKERIKILKQINN